MTGILLRSLLALTLVACGVPSSSPPGAASALFETPGERVPAGRQPGAVAVADLNGDGHPDVLTANREEDGVGALLGDGRGRFAPVPGSPFSAGDAPHLLAPGDFNGDSHIDVAVTSHDSNGVVVLLGDGRGALRPAAGSPFPAIEGVQPHNHGLVAADLDGDGRLDLATSNHNGNSVSVLVGDGRGGFRPAPRSPFSVGRGPYPLAAGDLNGDGRLDVATPNVGGGDVSVLLGQDGGRLAPASGSPHAVASRPYDLSLGDLNGDGRLDIVTAHDDITELNLLFQEEKGFRRSRLELGHRAGKTIIADVNVDDRPDLIAATASDALVVLLGDGRGRFTPAPGSPFSVGKSSWSVAVADVNHDGKPDLVTASSEEGDVIMLRGR